MNRIAVIILAVLLSGCYTQLQVANEETTYRPYVPPAPIIIIQPIYPYPPPCPDPYPGPPRHSVIIHPTEQIESPPAKSDRPRTEGSTRDDDRRADRGGNTGSGRR